MDSHFSNLKCNVCLDFYKDPRILSCGHTFCAECLGKLIKPAIHANSISARFNEQIIACPVCRKIDVTRGGVAGLSKNYTVADLVDSLHKCASGYPDDASDSNNHDRALQYCVDCRRSLCESCCTDHSPPTAGHVIKLLDNVTDTDGRCGYKASNSRPPTTSAPPPLRR